MIIKFIILILLPFNFIFGRDYAYPLKQGDRQMGIFQPRIYGVKNNIEISTHPVLFFIKPNCKIFLAFNFHIFIIKLFLNNTQVLDF